MVLEPLHRAIYLTGPTASGKTAIGVALARRLDAEIVAVDSMTLYRGMDIGTAKPTDAERGGIPHHLIDVLDPWQAASVAEYRRWALAAVEDIERRGKRVLFVGGTPLYLKALLRGLFQGPGADSGLRLRLEREAEEGGTKALHRRLAAVDPPTAARLHPNDRRRVIRALELIELTGQASAGSRSSMSVPLPRGPWSSRWTGPAPNFTTGSIAGSRRCSTRGSSRKFAPCGLRLAPSVQWPRRAWDIARSSRCWKARPA